MCKDNKHTGFKKRLIKRCIFIFAAAILIVVIGFVAKIETVAEFMTKKVSRYLIAAIGRFSSLFPFSLFEVLLVAGAIFFLIGLIIFFVRIKKRGKTSILKIFDFIAVVLCFVIFYQLCVGFAYHRAPLRQLLSAREIDDSFAATAAAYFAQDFSELANTLERDERGRVIMPYSRDELNQKLSCEFARLNSDYLNPYTPKYKKVGLSFIMAEFEIVGIFVGPLGEASITGFASGYQQPFFAAHEIAHAKGVMRESEADLVASYLLLTSDDPYFRYSAYMFNYFSYILPPIRLTNADLYSELYQKIPAIIFEEISASYEAYNKYNFFSGIGEKVNDWYLNLNGQKDGVGSYDDYGKTTPVEPSDPGEPFDPTEPPIYTHQFSFTEMVLLSVCPL